MSVKSKNRVQVSKNKKLKKTVLKYDAKQFNKLEVSPEGAVSILVNRVEVA